MKFICLDGNVIKIDIRPSRWPRKGEAECRSKFQWMVGQKIDAVFYNEIVLEEFYIPKEGLFIDFFLPRKLVAVEAHGNQHFQFNKFFHSSDGSFQKSIQRDNKKTAWCEINKIKLIIIRHNDNENVVMNKLLSYTC